MHAPDANAVPCDTGPVTRINNPVSFQVSPPVAFVGGVVLTLAILWVCKEMGKK
jgi:hypothetical protein